jgi:FkbM family methyltransferase
LKPTVFQRLTALPFLLRIWQGLHLRPLLAVLMEHFPLIRSLPGFGIVYRIKNPSSLWIANEVFQRESYTRLLHPGTQTLLDLGCNTGYFLCLAAQVLKNRNFQALAVDANPQILEETRWHLTRNAFTQTRVLWGLVGQKVAEGSTTADFFVHESHGLSSVHADHTAAATAMNVPILDLEKECAEFFGTQRIHAAKIDIEGAEGMLFKHSPSLLGRCDSVLLEWHKRLVPWEEIQGAFNSAGFCESPEILEDAPHIQLLLWKKPLKATDDAGSGDKP